MPERAEGFWWVRTKGYDESTVVQVVGEQVRWIGTGKHTPLDVAGRVHIAEWGPYLGKEPETIESLERKISEAFAAAVPRFVVPPQRD